MTNLVARYSSLKESGRLRVIGRFVLVLGIVGACVFYWVEPPSKAQILDESVPGYAKSQAHEMGILMGHTGVMMMEWQDVLDRPGTQAIIIAAVSGLFSLYFFRAAWVLDAEEEDRARQEKDG